LYLYKFRFLVYDFSSRLWPFGGILAPVASYSWIRSEFTAAHLHPADISHPRFNDGDAAAGMVSSGSVGELMTPGLLVGGPAGRPWLALRFNLDTFGWHLQRIAIDVRRVKAGFAAARAAAGFVIPAARRLAEA
jgi:hypothetical protein